MAAGLTPDTLWDQTPRTHAAIMKGKRQAFEAEVERDIALAWNVENFSRSGKKLRDLQHYLKPQNKRAQTAEEVVAIFESFAARGLATIRVRERE